MHKSSKFCISPIFLPCAKLDEIGEFMFSLKVILVLLAYIPNFIFEHIHLITLKMRVNIVALVHYYSVHCIISLKSYAA